MFKRVLIVTAALAASLTGFAGSAVAGGVGDVIAPPTGGSCGTGRGVAATVLGTTVKACVYVTSCTSPDVGANIRVNNIPVAAACVDPWRLVAL